MKNTLNYIAFAAMSLCVAACSQEDHESSYLSDPKAVQISAQIGSDGVTGGFQTRSYPIDDSKATVFEDISRIAVTAGSQSPVVYTQENGKWVPRKKSEELDEGYGDYLVWEDDKMYFTAFYPCPYINNSGMSHTNYSQVKDFSMSKGSLSAGDYMTFSGTLSNPGDNTVTLPMKRRTARLIISTTFRNQYESDYEVSAVKIHSNASGYIDGVVQRSDDGVEISSFKNPDDGKFYALLVPTFEDADKTFLTITIKNTVADYEESLTVKGIPALQEGYSYDMAVTVGKDIASVGNVTVSDWTNGDVIDNGSTNEVQPATADAATHTVTTHDEGQLTHDLISAALAAGTELKIVGPMGTADLNTLKSCNVEDLSLDLSNAVFTEIPYRGLETRAYHTTITEIKLPETLEKIGSFAFECSKLKKITIPKKVSCLGTCAFWTCLQLEEIVFEGDLNGENPALRHHSIDECKNLKTIDMSACTTVPAIDKYYPPMEDYYKSKNITIYVKNDNLKEQFESDEWFKDFTIEVKP